jgi:hypothetical protein
MNDNTMQPQDRDAQKVEASAPPRRRRRRTVSAAGRRRRRIRNVLVVLAVAVLIGLLYAGQQFVGDLFASTEDDGLIFKNVYAGTVNLGGLTPQQAEEKLQKAAGDIYAKQSIIIQLPDTTLEFTPEETNARLDVKKLVEDAYAYGRSGNRWEQAQARKDAAKKQYKLNLLDYLKLDNEYIKKALNAQNESIRSYLTQPTITVEGNQPSLSVDKSTSGVKHQTLVITMGLPERYLNVGTVYNQILDAYNLLDFTPIHVNYHIALPTTPDVAAAFLEYCVPVSNATLDPTTYEVSKEERGYEFDYDKALEAVSKASHGDVIKLKFKFVEPTISQKEVLEELFKDTLGSRSSTIKLTGNALKNLQKAVSLLNKTVILPGQQFSFNELIGEPTEEEGFYSVPSYENGEIVHRFGTGISQLASNLYYCALLGELPISEHYTHQYTVSFASAGLDALVVWGMQDLIFVNSTESAIQIKASISGSKLTVKLLGVDDRSYSTKLSSSLSAVDKYDVVEKELPLENTTGFEPGDVLLSGLDGCTAMVYLTKVNKSGKTLSKTLIDTVTYARRDQIICVAPPQPEPPIIDPTDPVDPTVPVDPTDPSQPGTDPTDPSTQPTTPSTQPTEATTASTGAAA